MAKTVVIKIGSNVLADTCGNIDVAQAKRLLAQLKQVQHNGYRVIAVISGAVQFGQEIFSSKSAAAALGQVRLIKALGNVGQILLRRSDLKSQIICENLCQIIRDFWRQGLIVVVNENDVVELNSFGGNDFLALSLARLVAAEQIILLSNVDGLRDRDNRVVQSVDSVNKSCWELVDDCKAQGVGGMTAKLKVARACIREGRRLVIANGKKANVLTQLLLQRKLVGTIFSKEQA